MNINDTYDTLLKKLKSKFKQLNNYLDNFYNMNKITIDGVSYDVEGNNVSIVKKRILVDGKVIVDNISGNTVHVKWEGDLAKLDCTSCEIVGNVHGKVDATSVVCGDVGGDIDATSVKCGNVAGDIDAVSVKRRKS